MTFETFTACFVDENDNKYLESSVVWREPSRHFGCTCHVLICFKWSQRVRECMDLLESCLYSEPYYRSVWSFWNPVLCSVRITKLYVRSLAHLTAISATSNWTSLWSSCTRVMWYNRKERRNEWIRTRKHSKQETILVMNLLVPNLLTNQLTN
jgi:hypothetical protein